MKKEEYQKIFVVIGIVGVLTLLFFLIRPVINALLGGVILAYLFHPFYRLLLKGIKNKTAASLLTIIILIILITLPLGFILKNIVQEASAVYQYSAQLSLGNQCTHATSIGCRLATWSKQIAANTRITGYLEDFFSQLARYMADASRSFFTKLPWVLLNMFVLFFSAFVFIKDGEMLFNRYKKYFPVSERHKEHFVKRFKEISYGVIYGTIVVALAQAVLATIGFAIFQVKAPIFWGLVVFVVSILPFIAPPVVYIPIGLFKILNGISLSEPSHIFRGIAIIVWGLALVGTIDNLIRYKITGDKAKVHPLLVLVGILGGIKLFGVVGIFFGPLVLVLALTMLEISHSK